MSERAVVWEPVADIDFPCPCLHFTFEDERLCVVMHFSKLNTDGEPRKRDLEIRFSGVIGLRWTPEFHGSIVQRRVPSRPKCGDPLWSSWVRPIVIVEGSEWLSQYMDLPGTENRRHFSLVCMDDLLDVVALDPVQVRWLVRE